MTGWRIGYVAAPAELLAAMRKIHQYIIMSAPTTAQEAAIEALKSGRAVCRGDARRSTTAAGAPSLTASTAWAWPASSRAARFMPSPPWRDRADRCRILRAPADGRACGDGARLGVRRIGRGMSAPPTRRPCLRSSRRWSARAPGGTLPPGLNRKRYSFCSRLRKGCRPAA